MSEWKLYRKTGATEMRPYVPGEDMTYIGHLDSWGLKEGGMIARNPLDPSDQWYVSKEFFESSYIPAREW